MAIYTAAGERVEMIRIDFAFWFNPDRDCFFVQQAKIGWLAARSKRNRWNKARRFATREAMQLWIESETARLTALHGSSIAVITDHGVSDATDND